MSGPTPFTLVYLNKQILGLMKFLRLLAMNSNSVEPV